MRCYLTTIRTAVIKRLRGNKHGQGCGQKATLVHCWWEYKLVEVPHDPEILLLDIHWKEMKLLSWKGIFTPMFAAAFFFFFTITKTWKQLKCPLMDGWGNNMQDIHTKEYYSAAKEKKNWPFVIWIELKGLMLSEMNQIEKRQIGGIYKNWT